MRAAATFSVIHEFGRGRPTAGMLRLLSVIAVFVGLAAAAPAGYAATMTPGCLISSTNQQLSCQQYDADLAVELGPLKAISDGAHDCYVKAGGDVFCEGQAETRSDTIPPNPWNYYWWQGLPTGATDVTSGRWHGCALAGGNVSCWGSNWRGQRGDGSTKAGYAAVVKGLAPDSAAAIDSGDFHTCAVIKDQTVRCWGSGQQGQLGNGTIADALTAAPVTGLADASTIAAGTFHTCALRTSGRVACWGANGNGQLGDGTTTDRRTPVEVAGLSDAIAVNAGRTHTCAIRAARSVVCWGTGLTAQLGLGSTTTRALTPAAVSGIAGATELLLTDDRTCARTTGDNVWCWGAGTHGAEPQRVEAAPATQVASLTDATSITTGNPYNGTTFCARRADGAAACWGSVNYWSSQYSGRAAAAEMAAPAPAPLPGVSDASAVSGTYDDGICTIRTQGTVDCRGLDQNRETFSFTWGPAGAPLTGVKAIGERCLVYTDGRAACYPEGTTIRSTPTEVSGMTDAVAVSGSQAVNCFLRANGHVLCRAPQYWEMARGNGSTSQAQNDSEVRGLTDAIDISANAPSAGMACAVRATGRVQCWGYASSRSTLGDGTSNASPVPVDVAGITDARKVSVGQANACVVHANGHVSCWGDNGRGQLGRGALGDQAAKTPQEVPGVTDAVAVAVGVANVCALRSGGGVVCWGSAHEGGLGDGLAPTGHFAALTKPTLLPFPVMRNLVPPRVIGPVVEGQRVFCDPGVWALGNRIAGADDHAFDDSSLYYRMAWNGPGSAWGGYYRHPYTDQAHVTVDKPNMACTVAAKSGVSPQSGGARAEAVSESRNAASTPYPDTLAAGGAHACAVRADATAWCWGSNRFGQLGRGTVGDSPAPVRVSGLTGVRSVAAGDRHACALLTDRSVRCWGFNLYGELGDGTKANQYTAVAVQGLTDAVQLSVGDRHTCALRALGAVVCWGLGASGRLGNGSTADAATPVTVSGVTDAFKVSAGGRSTCAVRRGGLVVCWGSGDNGRLGNGAKTSSSTPVAVGSGFSDAVDVAVSGSHACALRVFNLLRCWGANAHGQLGDGTTVDRPTPVQLPYIPGAYPIVQLGLGGDTSCVRIGGGKVYCWGAGASRQLGNGTITDRTKPAIVPGLDDASTLAVGPGRSCARRALSGHASCWGDVSATPDERPELFVAP